MNNIRITQHYHQQSPATKTVYDAQINLLDKRTRDTNDTINHYNSTYDKNHISITTEHLLPTSTQLKAPAAQYTQPLPWPPVLLLRARAKMKTTTYLRIKFTNHRNTLPPSTSTRIAPIFTNYHLALSRTGHITLPRNKIPNEAPMDNLHLDTISRTHHNNPPEDSLTPDTNQGHYSHSAPRRWTAQHCYTALAHTEEAHHQHLPLYHQDTSSMMKTRIPSTRDRRCNFREARRIYEPP